MICTLRQLISIIGVHALMSVVHSVFSVMAGLIVEKLFCCSPFITLHNGLKMSQYKAY